MMLMKLVAEAMLDSMLFMSSLVLAADWLKLAILADIIVRSS